MSHLPNEVCVQGAILPDGSLKLDSQVNLPPGPVAVSVRPLTSETSRGQPSGEHGLLALLRSIHADQERRGATPRSKEEIDRELAEYRAEWAARDAKIEAAHGTE